MLPFANTMFLDLLHEDGLLIAAKGLGLEDILYNLIKVHCDPGNLVLVMGTNEQQEGYFMSLLAKDGKDEHAKKITSDYSIGDRQKLYLQGGVLFVTTRILVMDMLTDKLPMDLISGILVSNAHRTASSCQEGFVLRLFRQKNQSGFIKALTETPESFKTGLCDMTRTLKNLNVKQLYLWPRFHLSVVESLSTSTPEVVELHVQMTEAMTTIQAALLDLINFSLLEIKRLNPNLLADELTMDNVISKSFHRQLIAQLEPIWHRLSWKTKQLVTDIKLLHEMLVHLTQYDCVTFNNYVSALRTTDNALKSGGWMLLDAAETLFTTAKARVYGNPDCEGREEKKPKMDAVVSFSFDDNPKWQALTEILSDIKTEIEELNGQKVEDEKVLLLTADNRVKSQIMDFLDLGGQALLMRLQSQTLIGSRDFGGANKVFKKKKGSSTEDVIHIVDRADHIPDASEQLTSNGCFTTVESVQIGLLGLKMLLHDLRPRYIIMYDVDVGAVRQLELYQACHPDRKIKVFFVMYGNSVEEQAYLTALRREKEAFEFLIKEKSSIVIQDTTSTETLGTSDAADLSNAVTRKGGGAGSGSSGSSALSKVIVDMREFRSELPSILHKRGLHVEPVTLEIGDYILSPDICVERKSISDLIGSLSSGRLFHQATAMTRYYAKPMLLIEFDQSKPFALHGKYYLSRDIANTDITARIQLLTIHFPKLRLLWSPSPHATGELFEELKAGREQPDATKAAGVSVDGEDAYNEERYNPAIRDFLSHLPGINSTNIFAVLNNLNNLSDLCQQSEDDLCKLLGHSQNAHDLFLALHDASLNEKATAERPTKKGGRFKTKARSNK